MGTIKHGASVAPVSQGNDSRRSVSALLSQVLVAFTIEFDNEFERRMQERGHPGARLSLVVWSNLARFIPEAGVTVHDLAARAFKTRERVRAQLGCLERWGFVELRPGAKANRIITPDAHRRPRRGGREGWGSGRGIRADWIVRFTPSGLEAKETWPPLFDEIEQRWVSRFGHEDISLLRHSLQAIVDRIDVELPHGLPDGCQPAMPFPPRITRDTDRLPLPTLLSQVLLVFAMEFDRDSPVPMALCANALRVLGETSIGVAEIPRLTGGSPEMSGVGWQLKPYVVVEPGPTRSRGKVAHLSPLGQRVRQTYVRLIGEVEERWEKRFGKDDVFRLRESLQALFKQRTGGPPPISAGLVPPPGVARAGAQAPSLGRRKAGPAARRRMRDLIAQTKDFVRDPAGMLPHYPLWDMNRGFGP